jgi:molecular chaperone GrpE
MLGKTGGMAILPQTVANQSNDPNKASNPAEQNGAEVAAASSDEPQATSNESAEKAPQAAGGPEDLRQELAKMRDQLLRTAADFDNFRKRSRRELEDAERRGREELLRDLLPVFDNLERAAGHAATVTDVRGLIDGLELVMRQFFDTLEKLGIERVPGTGTPFDPSVHEAIQQVESGEHPPGTVAAEVQAGYRMGERLIRPAMVVVAKAPAAT